MSRRIRSLSIKLSDGRDQIGERHEYRTPDGAYWGLNEGDEGIQVTSEAFDGAGYAFDPYLCYQEASGSIDTGWSREPAPWMGWEPNCDGSIQVEVLSRHLVDAASYLYHVDLGVNVSWSFKGTLTGHRDSSGYVDENDRYHVGVSCSGTTTIEFYLAPPPPSCADGAQNGTESDIDCGGWCGGTCLEGSTCAVDQDCASGAPCVAGQCAVHVPACDDGVQNGRETDIDCGGACTRCTMGHRCNVAADCTSGLICDRLHTCTT